MALWDKSGGMCQIDLERARWFGMRLGDDKLRAVTPIHELLYRANVNIYASSGVTDGKGTFGYLIYVRPESYGRAAAAALGV